MSNRATQQSETVHHLLLQQVLLKGNTWVHCTTRREFWSSLRSGWYTMKYRWILISDILCWEIRNTKATVNPIILKNFSQRLCQRTLLKSNPRRISDMTPDSNSPVCSNGCQFEYMIFHIETIKSVAANSDNNSGQVLLVCQSGALLQIEWFDILAVQAKLSDQKVEYF